MDLTLSSPQSPAREATLAAALTRFHHAAIRHEPATAATYRDLPESVNPILRRALADRGIGQLYSHQAETFQAVAQNQNVVVVTPTASGKTLVLQPAHAEPADRRTGRARHVSFPTKALAEDQLHELHGRHRPHGFRNPRIHLRWRYSARRPQSHPPARQYRAHQSGHAALRHPAAPHALGQAVRKSALHRRRRAALLSRRLWQPPGQHHAPAAAHASFTDRSRSSSLLGHHRQSARTGREP
jgi:hypothetical protein